MAERASYSTRSVGLGVGTATFITSSLIALWIALEGNENMPYLDIAGVPTVCSGHTGPDVIMGKAWTDKECEAVTIKDLTKFGFAVLRCVHVPLHRNQFEALVVFAGNVGEYAFCNSTLARKLNEGDTVGAEAQFERWVNFGCNTIQGCRKSNGLLNRRRIELAKFREVPPTTVIAQSRGAAMLSQLPSPVAVQ